MRWCSLTFIGPLPITYSTARVSTCFRDFQLYARYFCLGFEVTGSFMPKIAAYFFAAAALWYTVQSKNPSFQGTVYVYYKQDQCGNIAILLHC
jgi:hypothetical protein